MDVVKAMMLELHSEDAEKAKAEAIADALGELVGKRLERPTAHSVGKLFQKKLVGRPAFIADGPAFAILERFVGHNANTYQIHVTASREDLAVSPSPNTLVFADARQKHSPHSPHSPTRGSGDGEMGNDGKVGKDIPDSEPRLAGAVGYERSPGSWRSPRFRYSP